MAKVIAVCGYGSGISDAVARKFGADGFSVALVGRTAPRLQEAASALGKAGITAKAFPCDLGDLAAVRRLVPEIVRDLGGLTVIHWNAYAMRAGDLLTASDDDLRGAFDVSVGGLVAAVQAGLPSLKASSGAVLVTGGGFGLFDQRVDAVASQIGAMGLALCKSSQHKLTGLLHQRLKGEGVYVGEVMVQGGVKGTAFDRGQATLEASAIAERFFALYQARAEPYATIA